MFRSRTATALLGLLLLTILAAVSSAGNNQDAELDLTHRRLRHFKTQSDNSKRPKPEKQTRTLDTTTGAVSLNVLMEWIYVRIHIFTRPSSS